MSISILIVDDDPIFVQSAADMLETAGFRVVRGASTAAEAREAIRSLGPDAVLMDVNLPDGDGIALAAELCDKGDGPSVLLTSSDPSAAPRRVVERSGAIGFLSKTDLTCADFAALFGL